MPITQLRPERTAGHGIAETIMSFLQGKQIRRQREQEKMENILKIAAHDPGIFQRPEVLEYFKGRGLPTPAAPAPPMGMEEALRTPPGHKVSVTTGPLGRVKQRTITPSGKLPPDVVKAIQKGAEVIKRGADAVKVYNEIVRDFPDYALEIQRALLTETKTKAAKSLLDKLFGDL